MFARATVVEAAPTEAERGIEVVTREVFPEARKLDGFQGIFGAVDRESGKMLTFTLWESEEAMRASEEAANQLRGRATEQLAQAKTTVERYEVFLAEVPSLTSA